VSITVKPGVCSSIPSSEHITVAGLGEGVAMLATLTHVNPETPGQLAHLAVNDMNVSSPASVRNGDSLQIVVCAPLVFGFNETFHLKYGGHDDTVTVYTLNASETIHELVNRIVDVQERNAVMAGRDYDRLD
jgi:hypothetical protein